MTPTAPSSLNPVAADTRVRSAHLTEHGGASEAGSYLRLIDSWITQLKAHGPSRTYPLSAETLEPLTRFVRKLPKDSN